MLRALVACVLAVALIAATTVADARSHWPQPAAGASASGDPEIIFTFDDGPHEVATPLILDTLDKYGIHAIFFWTGWRVRGKRPLHDKRRALAARALAAGHIIGNHTVNHAHLCTIPADEAIRELDENASIYESIMQMPVRLLRAPYGDRCRRLEALLLERGQTHLHWDMDPLEWQSFSSVETRDYLIEQIRNLRGRAVILLHDTKPSTAKALPQVLDWIIAENLRRTARGQRPIRILSYADLAREQIPLPFQRLVDEAAGTIADFFPQVANLLVAPLAGPAPEVRHASNP